MPGEQQQQQQQPQQPQGGQQQQQGGQQQAAWHGIAANDTAGVEYVTNKGWQSPADVIKSYQGAEKLIGRDPSTLLVMPRGDDPQGFLGVMDKLGRPADASKYEFAKPGDGLALDEGYMGWARGAFHKVGITTQQAKELSAMNNEYIASVQKKQEADYKLSLTAEKQALQSEWRDGFERKMAAASAAARGLGFSPEMLDAIEHTVGYAKTMKLFSDIGSRMSDDSFVGSDTKTRALGGQLTPDEAKQQWTDMQMNPAEMGALKDSTHPNHKAMQEKQSRLFKIMYPE